MANLAEAVDAAETDWLVSADIPDTVDYLTVESEVVQVTATFPAQYQARDGSTSDPRIRVVRAAGGTTAASHADGTALTPLIPPSAAGGGAAEAGTVVVTPPTEVDIGAALEAAASPPSAENPYVTQDEIGIQSRIEAKTGEIVNASVETFANGSVHVKVFDELGVLAYSMEMEEDNFQLQNADLSAGFSIAANGLMSLNSGGAEYKIAADGALTMRNADASGTIAIAANGEIALSGLFTELSSPIKMIGLPTADPVVAGALWNDTGTLKVSAG